MPNIKEIAQKAGVSTSTVSRVLNNSPLISEETREHIMRIIREENYVPNSMARGLSNQRTYSVALLVELEDRKSFYNPFFYEVMHGIETVVYKHGLSLIITSQDKLNDDSRLDWLIQGKRAQGVILPSGLIHPVLIKKLKSQNFPFVVLGEPEEISEPIDWVDIHNQQGSQQAVIHLREQGYQNIAFLCGSLKEVFNRNRLNGYRSLVKGPLEYIIEKGTTKKDGFMMMNKLLMLKEPPDAVICGDNILSLGALKAVQQAGLRVPQDFGVLSFDNYPIAELIEPTLTSVDIDVFELGVQAAKMLLRLIDNPVARGQVSLISTSIQVRESTKRH